MIGRRKFLQALGGAAAARQPLPRPNLIVICTDDQGIGDVGCYGAADVQTPHLYRLAAEGIRFTDWHANSPVCSPSRASLVTGKYPQRAGIPQILFSKPGFDVPGLAAGEGTLAGELRGLGYRTAAIGKWHLGSAPASRPPAQGFDEFFGFYSGWIDYFSHRFYTLGGQPVYHDLWRNGEEVWEESVYQTALLTREARRFLRAQIPDRPFFLYLAYGAPHYPMMAPRSYVERFPASMDRDRRLHAAMLAALDDGIGEVTAELAPDVRRNTVIFFQSDNGATREERADHRGRPYRGGSNGRYRGYKGSLFEGGIRVPALLSWPARIRGGQVMDRLALSMDLLPTFLRWAGGEPPAGIDGKDLSAMLLEGADSPHAQAYWDYDGQLAVRAGPWKLVRHPREALNEPPQPVDWLSNLADDPGEKVNRAASDRKTASDLAALLARWPFASPGTPG